MRHGECAECERLWREYAEATFRHIHLTGKWRLAHLQGDPAAAERLEAETATAEEARWAARQAIREHEALVHGEPAGDDGKAAGA